MDRGAGEGGRPGAQVRRHPGADTQGHDRVPLRQSRDDRQRARHHAAVRLRARVDQGRDLLGTGRRRGRVLSEADQERLGYVKLKLNGTVVVPICTEPLTVTVPDGGRLATGTGVVAQPMPRSALTKIQRVWVASWLPAWSTAA